MKKAFAIALTAFTLFAPGITLQAQDGCCAVQDTAAVRGTNVNARSIGIGLGIVAVVGGIFAAVERSGHSEHSH